MSIKSTTMRIHPAPTTPLDTIVERYRGPDGHKDSLKFREELWSYCAELEKRYVIPGLFALAMEAGRDE